MDLKNREYLEESKYENFSKKQSSDILKDLIILVVGFLIGKFIINLGFFYMVFWLLFIGFLVYFILGELFKIPLSKWHVTAIKVRKENTHNFWNEFKDNFNSKLNGEIVNLRKRKFTVYFGKIEDSGAIVIASRYKPAIDYLKSKALGLSALNDKEVSITENTYSFIQSFLGFNFLPNKGWYPKIKSAFTEDWEFSRFDISLISHDKTIKETFETICNQIDSLEIFKKEQKVNSAHDRRSTYLLKKGLFKSSLKIFTLGTDIHVQINYSEEQGIEFDNEGLMAKNQRDLLHKLSSKLKEVLRSLKNRKIAYKNKLKEVGLFVGKYDQSEILLIVKYNDRKKFTY